MYLEHFGFSELPFSLTPDPGYFFRHSEHQEALNVLLVALQGGEGFVKITGEVGTGKTLLCRTLLDTLDAHYVTAYLPNPLLDPLDLYRAVAAELGLAELQWDDLHGLLNRIVLEHRSAIEAVSPADENAHAVDQNLVGSGPANAGRHR